jgi:hypothetical protein
MINRKGKGATMQCPSLVTLSVSLLMLLLLSAGPAAGKTLYVKTSGKDSASCIAADPCQTITHAVSVAASGDTIAVGAGTFAEGDGILINKDLTIAGGWFLATRVILGWIDKSQKFVPVIFIGPSAKVKLTNLTISGGSRGGIDNFGNLTLTNVWITNNTGSVGAGVSNAADATLLMTNVGITHNSGPAGLVNVGTAFLIDARVEATSPLPQYAGGGIVNKGTLLVNRGLIAGNNGAGLHQYGETLTDCTATAYLINVTISGNQHRGIDAECGQLILRHVTVAANTAPTGAGGLQIRYTIPVLDNSIVATNSGKQCYLTGEVSEVKGISISHSLIGDDSCIAFPPPHNLVGVDPKLSALVYRAGDDLIAKLFHIGANRVQALLPGSPAIDSGADALCTYPISLFGEGWLTDQLGAKRPVDGDGDGKARCDMGAYEYQPPK